MYQNGIYIIMILSYTCDDHCVPFHFREIIYAAPGHKTVKISVAQPDRTGCYVRDRQLRARTGTIAARTREAE